MSVHAGTTSGRAPAPTTTPFASIGGTPTLRSAVERLYFWITRNDDLFNAYFRDVDLTMLKAKMVTILSQALGGPKAYSMEQLAAAHVPLGITDEHYARVGKYVVAALLVEDVPWAVADAVRITLDDLKPVICGRA